VVSANVDKPRTVEYKSTMDLVTDTDKASEAAVLKARPLVLLQASRTARVALARASVCARCRVPVVLYVTHISW